MALADLMKKGFLSSATATIATSATKENESTSTVATVATVAVTSPADHKKRIDSTKENVYDTDKFQLFRFDLIEQEIAAGANPEELERINNMAWEFMQVDGLEFSEAIKTAAEIVITCQVAACEAAYTNVRDLLERHSIALH